jgi:hypothetical protein
MFHNFYIVLLVNQRKKFMNFIMSYYWSKEKMFEHDEFL